jgi:hypothetical protein
MGGCLRYPVLQFFISFFFVVVVSNSIPISIFDYGTTGFSQLPEHGTGSAFLSNCDH